MRQIKKALFVKKLLSKHSAEEAAPRKLSQYMVLDASLERPLLFHTLTGEVFATDPEEADLLSDLLVEEMPGGRDAAFWKSRLGNALFEELSAARFLVPEAADEAEEYHRLLRTLRLIRPAGKGYDNFTILPTTACNARCFYCFESGYRMISMDRDQAEAVRGMIEREYAGRQIRLRWFGGEPLMGTPAIRAICAGLTAKGIPFESSMVTNGLLLSPKLIREAVRDWNLKTIQITLDGTQEEYERRKAYVSVASGQEEDPPFFRVIRNLHLVQEAGLRLVLRLNADPGNMEDLFALEDFLEKEFPDRTRIKIYAVPLFSEYRKEKSQVLDLARACLELNRKAKKAGFATNRPYTTEKFRTHQCMADDPNSIVIGADGRLTHCEDCIEGTFFGNCREGITDAAGMEQLRDPEKRREVCGRCAFLPACTDYPNCPHELPEGLCREIMEMRLHYALEQEGAV